MTIKKPLVITTGEPAGIGPDIVLQLWQQNPDLFLSKNIRVLANKSLLQARAKQLNLNQSIDQLPLIDVPLQSNCITGQLNADNASYVIDQLTIAAQGCLDQQFCGMVTGPIHKGILNEAGFSFSGHTEFLTRFTQVNRTVMMLMTQTLKVALFSDHVPLRQVPNLLTTTAITQCLDIIHHDFRTRFGLCHPTVLVCGLNPHAGEDGYLGTEEKEILIPALNTYRQHGHHVIGPIAADVAFTKQWRDKADVILAMYHDQGLGPLKYAGFHEAINVTLGLPFVRTSVDHGTALDIAGTGLANPNSLLQAITLAIQLTDHLTKERYDSTLPTLTA